ncbi:MAG: zinc ABC transporter substrate-binding protein [Candidatus Omnitrophica bacterium]|nr:zinc ABC transporter substrate-binding protein [Candidatus Omnitrophota bacterium]
MKIKKNLLMILALYISASPVWAGSNKIKIVTTTSTFASMAKEIAGDRADIYFIASPSRDIHFISPTPRDVMKLKKADLFIHAGLDLESWRGPLLDAVGRLDLMWPTGERQIDVSNGISLLEIPASLSRAQGDIHAYGNPHYVVDPANALIVSRNIQEGLSRFYTEYEVEFQKNEKDFSEKLQKKMQDWDKRMLPYHGYWIVTYHRSWTYLAKRFGLEILGQLEPKPGIPPTSKHLAGLMKEMKEKKAKVIIKESYNESRTANHVAQETGAVVVDLAQSVGESKEAPDYIQMMELNISRLENAFKKGS